MRRNVWQAASFGCGALYVTVLLVATAFRDGTMSRPGDTAVENVPAVVGLALFAWAIYAERPRPAARGILGYLGWTLVAWMWLSAMSVSVAGKPGWLGPAGGRLFTTYSGDLGKEVLPGYYAAGALWVLAGIALGPTLRQTGQKKGR